jgi:hypothetical protein
VIHDFLYSNWWEVIKKYKKLSKIFSLDEKRIIWETFWFSEDHLVIDRYLCDKICFLGIFIEYREIRKKITWKIKLKALLWYFWVRIGGKKHFYD